jgi:hypothetical protein
MNRTAKVICLMTVVLGVGLACSKQKQQASEKPVAKQAPMMAEKEYMVMGEYVSSTDSLPRLRYFDGDQVSLNDRCAVRKAKLNPKMPPIYVNGQPVGFC